MQQSNGEAEAAVGNAGRYLLLRAFTVPDLSRGYCYASGVRSPDLGSGGNPTLALGCVGTIYLGRSSSVGRVCSACAPFRSGEGGCSLVDGSPRDRIWSLANSASGSSRLWFRFEPAGLVRRFAAVRVLSAGAGCEGRARCGGLLPERAVCTDMLVIGRGHSHSQESFFLGYRRTRA